MVYSESVDQGSEIDTQDDSRSLHDGGKESSQEMFLFRLSHKKSPTER
jgi:hypothetical protein